jgi:DNA polymerase III subunit epsilon
MFNFIKNYFNKKNLKDEKYLFLFDEAKQDEYVCLDCETTGLDVQKDDIISIGAVIIKGNTIIASKKFVKLIKPKTKLQEDAIKVHHIREMDLEEAEDIEDAIEEFLQFLGNRKIVGYYLEFDLAMINKYLKPKLGIILPNKTYEVSAIYHDYKIEKIPQSHIDLRFDTIIKDLKIPMMGKHDAYNDAVMTAMMFIKLKNQAKVKIR